MFKDKKRFTIYLDEKIIRLIKVQAAKNGESASDLILAAVMDFVEKHEERN